MQTAISQFYTLVVDAFQISGTPLGFHRSIVTPEKKAVTPDTGYIRPSVIVIMFTAAWRVGSVCLLCSYHAWVLLFQYLAVPLFLQIFLE